MPEEIAEIGDLARNETYLFTVEKNGDRLEAIALQREGEFFCYENYCQHWSDVRLDDGDDASIRRGEIVCEKHAAMFEIESGICNHGPCEGSRLRPIDTEVRDDKLYLTDDDYGFVSKGGMEHEDSDSHLEKGTRGGMGFQV